METKTTEPNQETETNNKGTGTTLNIGTGEIQDLRRLRAKIELETGTRYNLGVICSAMAKYFMNEPTVKNLENFLNG